MIRQNRDTLYSVAIVDVGSDGVALEIPEMGDRYISVMVINQDHCINQVFHRPGTYELTKDDFGTDYLVVAARILSDPDSASDLAEVHRIQDALRLMTGTQRDFVYRDYDGPSHQQVRDALLVLGRTMGGLPGCFGRAEEVDPVRHLVGTALGWGGLPDAEASYLNVDPARPVGRYTMTFSKVPADAFWSVSVYNAAGCFEPDDSQITNVNSVFAAKNPDGSTSIYLGDFTAETPNRIPLPEGWNLLIQLYRHGWTSSRTGTPHPSSRPDPPHSSSRRQGHDMTASRARCPVG